MNNKIGLGLVTYNAPERIKKSAFTVPKGIDSLVIVNDGTEHLYDNDCYPKQAEVIQHKRNLGVGCAKNTALRYLMQSGVEHLFLMEDDIMISDENMFSKYIEGANKSGLHHLLYAYHGPGNLKPAVQLYNGSTAQPCIPNPREIIDYGSVKISLNAHCVGAMCYFHRGIIKNLGYFDERYKNCWEHVSHSLKIVEAGLLPAYWYWPDLADSMQYLKEIASSEVNTTIPHTDEWKQSFQKGAQLFKRLHNYFPTEVPDTPREEVIKKLEFIKTNYARKT